jgi:ferritin
MIGEKMQDALNGQIQSELSSAYLYLAMAAHCGAKNLKGAAHWLRLQNKEETEHALKLLGHLVERGGRPSLGAIDAPPADFGSLGQVFEAVLDHERRVTAEIHKLYELALSEKDYAAQVFLQWFVNEQVEEEARASEILERLRYAKESPASVLYLDKELGKRQA